jgi:hypothetical protein
LRHRRGDRRGKQSHSESARQAETVHVFSSV